MKILILDNYDSFTYNLYHLVRTLGEKDIEVVRNDQIKIEDVNAFDKIILSPGPGIPDEAGLMLPIIKKYAPTKKILGVCLGHQAIGEVFGGHLENLTQVYHGIQSPIDIVSDDPIYKGIGQTMLAGRYHSWIVSKENFPSDLEISAVSREGYIMGLRHKHYNVYGIQFHPESVLTPKGNIIMQNFLNL